MPISRDNIRIIEEIFEAIITGPIWPYKISVNGETFDYRLADNGGYEEYDATVPDTGDPCTYKERTIIITQKHNGQRYDLKLGVRIPRRQDQKTTTDSVYLIYTYFKSHGFNTRIDMAKAIERDWSLYGTTRFFKKGEDNNQRRIKFENCLKNKKNDFLVTQDGAYLGRYEPSRHDFPVPFDRFAQKFFRFSILKSHYLCGPIKLRSIKDYGTET
jgi:hypothetical protein